MNQQANIRCFSSKTKEENSSNKDDKKTFKIGLSKENRKLMNDYLELTKFKLSLLNSVGAFTMFYFHAPLAGMGLWNSGMFLFAT